MISRHSGYFKGRLYAIAVLFTAKTRAQPVPDVSPNGSQRQPGSTTEGDKMSARKRPLSPFRMDSDFCPVEARFQRPSDVLGRRTGQRFPGQHNRLRLIAGLQCHLHSPDTRFEGMLFDQLRAYA